MWGPLIKREPSTAQEPIPLEVRPLRSPATLDFLESLSYLMDRCFQVPNSNARYGINTLLLFLPVIGDLIAMMVSFTILAVGLTHYKVPRIVATRMTINTLLDSAISLIPGVGNVWDVWYKADTRNVQLLREYLLPGEQPRPLWHHWVFVLGAFAALAAVVMLIGLGLAMLMQMLAGR